MRPTAAVQMIVATGLTVGLTLALASLAVAQGGSTGIVASIGKAPVVSNGDVQGALTDYVITLDASLDPAVPGRSLEPGDTVAVSFPENFDLADLGAFPLAGVGSVASCVPGNLQCTTAVLIQGWPQNPLPPSAYALSVVDNTLVFTITAPLAASPPVAPGFKQIHLIFNGVENPKPGQYRIGVEIATVAGVETGSGLMHVVPHIRPSVNLTSVFAENPLGTPSSPPNPNVRYQKTTMGGDAPYVWSLLLWDRDGEPVKGVSIRREGSGRYRLQGGKGTVGHITIKAPVGGEDAHLLPGPVNGMLPAAPVIGFTPGVGPQPVGRLDLQFVAGSAPGDYTTVVSLNGGTSEQLVVTAVSP